MRLFKHPLRGIVSHELKTDRIVVEYGLEFQHSAFLITNVPEKNNLRVAISLRVNNGARRD